jgi:hypothetical protein
MNLEQDIEERIGEVKTGILDLSIGEIVNLHGDKELVIQPEYQRLFRWSDEQRSRLVESVTLELPIPQIFLIENADGVLEVIDGLQRVSSLIQFMNPEAIGLKSLVLHGCDIIRSLNETSYEQWPMTLKLRFKRSTLRCILIRKQSKSFLRYEMFKRLNTGGSILSPQEIRNCSARMLGNDGGRFYEFLQQLSSYPTYVDCIESLSQSDFDQKGNEELVLRFFALKNAEAFFRGSVRDWLDDYMEAVLLKKVEFDDDVERYEFERLFGYLGRVLGRGAFVKYRANQPIGALAPAYFEAVAMGVYRSLSAIMDAAPDAVRDAIIGCVQSENFRSVTGPGANSKEKLRRRVTLITEALMLV